MIIVKSEYQKGDIMNNQLTEELKKKEETLQFLQKQLENSIKKAPEGRLRISHKKGKPLYYHRSTAGDKKASGLGTYIRKKDVILAQELAQKEYEEILLKNVQNELKTVQNYLNKINENGLTEAYELLSEDRKRLVIPKILSVDQKEQQWLEETYTGKGFAINDPEIYTEKNERVRSKSEKILADKFFLERISYKYECPLNLEGYGTIYPDFTVFNKRTGEIFFWEHLGMMDNPAYAEKAIQKIETYEKNNIFPGRQLILSYETKNLPLNMKVVEKLIKEFLL